MKKASIYLFLMSVVATSIMPTVQAEEWDSQVRLGLGSKQLDSNDWPQHDEHGSISLITDIKQQDWPVSIAIDLSGTGEDTKLNGDRYEGYTAEAHLGVRHHFEFESALSPYIGIGLAFTFAEERLRTSGVRSEDEDTSTGFWLGAGFDYAISPAFSLGLDVRYSEAEVSLFNTDREMGGTQYGVTLGYSF